MDFTEFMIQDTEKYSFKTDSYVSKQENYSTLTFTEEPNYYANSTNQSDYSAYLFIMKYLAKKWISDW